MCVNHSELRLVPSQMSSRCSKPSYDWQALNYQSFTPALFFIKTINFVFNAQHFAFLLFCRTHKLMKRVVKEFRYSNEILNELYNDLLSSYALSLQSLIALDDNYFVLERITLKENLRNETFFGHDPISTASRTNSTNFPVNSSVASWVVTQFPMNFLNSQKFHSFLITKAKFDVFLQLTVKFFHESRW